MKRKNLLKYILVAALSIAVGLIVNALSPGFELVCKKYLGEYWWVVLAVLLPLLTVVFTYLTTENGNPQAPLIAKGEVARETTDKIREFLRRRYSRRRAQKMANRLPVNLNFYASFEGLREELRSSYEQLPSEQATRRLVHLFRQTQGRLLLLGRPGAGKTMQVLELASELLDTEPDALPVVLNLATWTDEFKDLQAWLLKTLPYELGVNEPLAARLLANARVILLLDGFDEIQETYRPLFFEKMADWVAEHPQCEYLISSRVAEYLHAAAKVAPPVTHQPVEVAPLQPDQLRSALDSLALAGEPEAQRFLAALQDDTLLKKIAATPFYFNCLQALFARKPYPEWNFQAKTRDGLEAEITTFFIQQELQKCQPETEGYLRYLAGEMQKRKMVKVELVDLQYDWVERFSGRNIFTGMFIYLLTNLFAPGLFISLILFPSLLLLLSYHDFRRYPVFLILLPLTGSICGLLGIAYLAFMAVLEKYNLHSVTIRAKEKVFLFRTKFSLRKNENIYFLAFIIVLSVYLLFYREENYLSLIILILALPLLYFANVLHNYYNDYEILIQADSTFSRFKNSAQNLHFSILQHWHLRYIMARRGHLPWRLVSFLNEMAPLFKNKKGELPKRIFTTSDVYLMESDGATWRFRHRIIQNWFSENKD